jgi:hemerythrin-like metal-binding protein
MPVMQWSEDLSVGSASIDLQHCGLMDLINELYDAMMNDSSKMKTIPILHKLIRATADHFALEESLLAQAGYAELADHRLLHRELSRQIEEFSAQLISGEANLSISILRCLANWLITHIQDEDKRYEPCLKSRGIL